MCVWLYHIALPSFIRMWPDLGKRACSLCIQFFNFGGLHYLFGMTCTCTAFRDYRYTISLLFLKVSMLYNIPCDFYGSLNEQNWMCELRTLSQIWSHMYLNSSSCNIMVCAHVICTICTFMLHLHWQLRI